MDGAVNIRELKRLVNIILKDLSDLSQEQLEDFNEVGHRIFTHTSFESSFRLAVNKAKEEVPLTS